MREEQRLILGWKEMTSEKKSYELDPTAMYFALKGFKICNQTLTSRAQPQNAKDVTGEWIEVYTKRKSFPKMNQTTRLANY